MKLTQKLGTLLLTTAMLAVFVTLPGCKKDDAATPAKTEEKKTEDKKTEEKKADEAAQGEKPEENSQVSTENEKPKTGPKGAGSTTKTKDPFATIEDF